MVYNRTFVIDSENLQSVVSRLYGYMVTDDGEIYVDEIPEKISDTGMFILVQKTDGVLIIKQDFLASFGLYLYRKGKRFCISNSFFRLAEHRKGKITPHKAAIRELASCPDVPMWEDETPVREIRRLKSQESIQVDLHAGTLTVLRKEYNYYKRKLDCEEAFRDLDDWYYKWVRVFRNLVKEHCPVRADLSGGLDTRLILSMLRNSNVDINSGIEYQTHDFINLEKDKEDRQIAREIASELNLVLNKEVIPQSMSDAVYTAADAYGNCRFSTFGRSLMCKYVARLYDRPVFCLKGLGSTTKGGYWKKPEKAVVRYVQSYLDMYSPQGILSDLRIRWKRRALKKSFRRRSEQILEGYEHTDPHRSTLLYKKLKMENMDAGKAMDWMAAGQIVISPFIDPALAQFDYDPGDRDILFLNTLILDRYDPELLRFPIEGRAFKEETLSRVRELNQRFPLTRPDFEAVIGSPSGIGVVSLEKDDIPEFLGSLCRNPDFNRALCRFIPSDYVQKVLGQTDFDKMNLRLQTLNGFLAIYELLKLF